MWCICAVAVAVLNLDAAVVLCTPLAVALARRGDLDPVAFGFQPALLACLASSALPVSNLTNLIAVSQDHLTPVELLRYLGLPTLVACTVGYGAWRLAFRHRDVVARHPLPREGAVRRPLVIGGAVLATLLVGFLLGRSVGIAAWMVVAVVDLALVGLRRRVPWDAVPWGTAAVAAGLAVVAAAAADRTGLADWLVTNGVWSQVFVAAGAANVINNLPAFLVAVPHTTSVPQVAALLLGVNAGPTIVITGSLAGLLWLDSARRSGLVVGPREYARVGVIAGVPALVAATAVLALTT
jgi:arsenical pump membrane protein